MKVIHLATMLAMSLILVACEDNKNETSTNSKTEERNEISVNQQEKQKLEEEAARKVEQQRREKYMKADETIKYFDFSKEIALVKIEESNTKAFKETPHSGIATTKATFSDEYKMLEIYHNATLPNANTDLVVMYDAYTESDLIYSNLISLDDVSADAVVTSIENKYVNNKNRLFNNKQYSMSFDKDGKLKFTINGETKELAPGETVEIKLGNETIGSTLVVENIGFVSSKENMRYQFLEDVYVMDDSELSGDSWEQAKEDLPKNMGKVREALREEERKKREEEKKKLEEGAE